MCYIVLFVVGGVGCVGLCLTCCCILGLRLDVCDWHCCLFAIVFDCCVILELVVGC